MTVQAATPDGPRPRRHRTSPTRCARPATCRRGPRDGAWLAMRLRRPLLLEGEPGTGKTALAEALAESAERP